MKREFILQDDKSNKFWTVDVDGSTVVTTNGRIGAAPRETRKELGTPDKARAFAEKEILGKLKKGYSEGSLDAAPAYGKRLPPKLIRIHHDDYHAKYVGKTKAGDQFFLTFPFSDKGNYIALYLFDAFGALKAHRIHAENEEGLRTQTKVDAFIEQVIADLGGHKFGNIKVAPFSLEVFGQTFGLVYDAGDDDDGGDGDSDDDDDDGDGYGDVWVTVEPGNYMAFFPPWDGEYDT